MTKQYIYTCMLYLSKVTKCSKLYVCIFCGMTSTVLTTKHGYGQNGLLSELVKVLGKLGEKKELYTYLLS